MAKKVLIMTQNFYPVIGSSGNRMKNIYQLLNENGVDADVLTTEPAYPNKNMYKDKAFWDEESLNGEQEKIIRVPIKNNRFQNHLLSRLFFYLEIMYRFLTQLWKLKKNNYDYILVSTPPIFIVFSAFLGKYVLKSKIILEVRDLWPDSLIGVKTFHNKWIINLFRILEKRMYRSADAIIINSIGFKEHIQSKLKQNKTIHYIPNGPRLHEIVDENAENDTFSVVYTGNLGLAQDIDHLKQVARRLHEEGIRFDVIGYGVRTEDFSDYLDEHALTNVFMHEPTTRKKSLELIKNSNIAIAFLNDEEVFSTVLPGKVIDYMTCKTPIIAGVKGTAAEMITSSKAGFTFDQKDIEGIVQKILELKEDRQAQQELGENGIETVKKHFLWENNIKKLIDIIK